MARIFCIANQKGGVGKTTTTVNLAAGLARIEKRVLVIDLDPQGNATMGSGVDKRGLELSVYDVLLENASIAEARQHSAKVGYDMVGANRELAGAEVEVDLTQDAQLGARSTVDLVDTAKLDDLAHRGFRYGLASGAATRAGTAASPSSCASDSVADSPRGSKSRTCSCSASPWVTIT